MHFSNKILIFITAGLIAGGLIFFSTRPEKKVDAALSARILAERAYHQAKVISQPRSPQIVLQNAELFVFGNNQFKRCSIRAQESKIFHNTNQTECTQVFCTVLTNQDAVATLQAPHAFIDNKSKNVSLPGKVQGTFQEWSLDEHNVFYNANTHTITSADLKLTNTQGIQAEADNGLIDLENKKIILEKNVRCQFTHQ